MLLYQRKHNTNFRLPLFLLKHEREIHHFFFTLQVAAQGREASQHFEITITAFRICRMMYNSKKCSRNLLYAIFRKQISQYAMKRIFCTRRNSTAFALHFFELYTMLESFKLQMRNAVIVISKCWEADAFRLFAATCKVRKNDEFPLHV